MKLTTGILLLLTSAGTVWGQNPDVIWNTKNAMKAVQQRKAADSDAALAAAQAPAAKPAGQTTANSAKPAVSHVAPKPVPATGAKQKAAPAVAAAAKPKRAAKPAASNAKAVAVSKKSQPKQRIAVESKKNGKDAQKEAPKAINLSGRRDPFISPVVNRSMVGSGCSTGKRCLAIGQINLKGIVKAEAGMIAVVVNATNKAYFLRENDPVFDGYVVKITGDSIVFKETVQDKLGKRFTREVTKKITTPAV